MFQQLWKTLVIVKYSERFYCFCHFQQRLESARIKEREEQAAFAVKKLLNNVPLGQAYRRRELG
ncbi:hypothetical protein CU100_15635 [Phyllobacterium endophyticum]|uniref:Uncharacterized protein n=1 Tax=Phyllobacterium endophyticum TaxID=1149773 RepID=A0A2P7ARB9_9HYPH|nr:hypothetical protein CU100_15635 [Phyllobacterium endophyticum]